MKIQRFRKQQYFSHEVAIAVYYAVNYAYEFKPGSENRYLRDFWKITYIEKGSGVHLFNEVRHPFEEGSILLSRPSDLTTAELESDIRLYNILFFKEALGSWLQEAGGNHDFFAVFQDDREPNSIHDPVCLLKGNRKIKMAVRPSVLAQPPLLPGLLRSFPAGTGLFGGVRLPESGGGSRNHPCPSLFRLPEGDRRDNRPVPAPDPSEKRKAPADGIPEKHY